MPKDAAYWREYRARKSGKVAQPIATATREVAQPQPQPSVALASSSPAPVREVSVTKRCNLPNPRQRAPILAPPAPREQYERAKAMFADGCGFREVKSATGCSWLSLDEAAREYDDADGWRDAQDRHKAAMAARIAGAAIAAGCDGVKRKVVRKTVNGVVAEETVTEEQGTDAALLRVAGEYTDPERFGKLAGAKAAAEATGPRQITVVYLDQRRQGEEMPGAPTLEATP